MIIKIDKCNNIINQKKFYKKYQKVEIKLNLYFKIKLKQS
jgi:hypothetical protein